MYHKDDRDFLFVLIHFKSAFLSPGRSQRPQQLKPHSEASERSCRGSSGRPRPQKTSQARVTERITMDHLFVTQLIISSIFNQLKPESKSERRAGRIRISQTEHYRLIIVHRSTTCDLHQCVISSESLSSRNVVFLSALVSSTCCFRQ